MDAFQARRPIGGDPQQPQSLFWHPPSSSSSSSPIGGYHHHQDPHLARLPSPPASLPPHQPGYPLHHHHPPPPPQQHPQQQWLYPDSRPILQQPAPSFLPHPPVPPYHAQPPVPSYPSPMPPAPHQYLSPALPTHPPHRPPTMPPPLAHHHLPPPPTAAYPPPNQGWGNPSWAQHQAWEYPAERNLPYNNEEDWAARAKAWAAAKSATENHHRQAQIMPTGRIEDHGYAYHEQYQQAAGPPTDNQQPSHSQLSNQQLPAHLMDQQKQVSHVHGSTSFSSGSSFYGTDGRPYYNAEDEASGADKDHMTSSQRNFGPSSSTYEQEVPYCYSSTQGDRESVNQSESLQQPFPLPASSVQEGFLHSQSTLPVRNISVEQAHFTHIGQSSKLIPDVSDQPLDFQPRSASGLEPHPQISYEHADLAGSVGVMDHDAIETSIHSWTPSAAPRVFSHIPLAPTGTQFDPSFASQSSLPVPPAPVYVRVPGTNFRPSIPPVTAPFGLGSGTSLHHAAAFSGDAKAAFNLSERPKKSAVPNWLREEIIKNKSVLANAGPNHQNGSSFHSIQSEDDDKSSKGVDQAGSKSMESTKSTEDEEDDEDDVEAARSAAFNQEIKRVLTEVLMKVTDELFDEIATNVLNEDNPTVEVSDHADVENHEVSFPAASTPKTSAKVLVPAGKSNKNIGGTGENSSSSSSRGDILGLANYASDDDDDVDDCVGDDGGTQSSNLLSSGMVIDASHQQETSGRVSANVLERVEKGIALVNKEKPSENVHKIKSQRYRTDPTGSPPNLGARDNEGNSVMQYASSSDNKLHGRASDRMARIGDVQTSVESRKFFQFSPDSSNSLQSNDKAGKESTVDDAKNGKSVSGEGHVRESKSILSNNRHPEKRSNSDYPVKEAKAVVDKTVLETSGAKNFTSHEGREKVKKEKRDNIEEKAQDRGGGGKNMRESDSRSSSKHTSARDDRKDVTKDKRKKDKEDCAKKGEQIRDEKEDRSTRGMKDEVRYKTRRPPSPSSRVRSSKENSLHGYGSLSGDDRSDNSKKRKVQSHRGSSSPSPTKSRIRQVSRSPHSKHSHRRNSPYSSLDRRRRSRSTTPVNRRR
ncbi:uncharacterized protein LOC103696292 isoform X2 [Phoenix dactylifera]|uniref:Uncharacterized protein LOC103696292 isoform X2 n=1 Tax=Phoenix dactylifera TaxID=42345 RepID=A0A8B7BGA3_PHODC|nr:uncharacterized protein LOC103696292 isoform X2 [Phoenix dactylifera]